MKIYGPNKDSTNVKFLRNGRFLISSLMTDIRNFSMYILSFYSVDVVMFGF